MTWNPSEIRVIVVDDQEPTTLQEVKRSIGSCFTKFAVTATHYSVSGTSSDWSDEAQTILGMEPDIVLSDCYMPENASDGARLLYRLCCDFGFRGFVYLWSSTDPSSVCAEYPFLLGSVGGGGFRQDQIKQLALKVKADYEALGGCFAVTDPTTRCFDVLDETLEVLSNVLPACYRDRDMQRLLDTAKHHIGVDSTHPDFAASILQQCAKLYGSRGEGERRAVRNAARDLGCTNNVTSELAAVRNALLALCAACDRV